MNENMWQTSAPIKALFSLVISFVLFVLVTGCSDSTEQTEQAPVSNSIVEDSFSDKTYRKSKQQVLEIIEALFEGAITRSGQLIEETNNFVKNPTQESFNKITNAFNDAHQAYSEAQLGRVFGLEHPLLDLEDSAQGYHSVTSRIDSFPLLPGYLDSVSGYPRSGLIHSELAIDIDTLVKEHHFSDNAYVTLGFHAFEFIMKGDPEVQKEVWNRFQLSGETADIKAAQRRINYLTLLSKQIHEDIRREAEHWLSEDGFYRSNLIGMATLSYEEVASRLQEEKALESYLSAEAEHFSVTEAQAVSAVWNALTEALSPAAKPEETAPSDSSSPESPEAQDDQALEQNAQ